MSISAAKLSADELERKRLGGRLRQARKYLGFTQDEVAGHLSIPRTALVEIEKGTRRIEAVELKKLAKLYGHPTSHFIDDSGGTADLSPDVAHLAREAEGLSKTDRAELLQFADFLKSRVDQKSK